MMKFVAYSMFFNSGSVTSHFVSHAYFFINFVMFWSNTKVALCIHVYAAKPLPIGEYLVLFLFICAFVMCMQVVSCHIYLILPVCKVIYDNLLRNVGSKEF
jgi:hypothetical protein